MAEDKEIRPKAVAAIDVAPQVRQSNYPEPFLKRVAGREKRRLGDVFGLKNFGVNLTILPPGAESALLHRHAKQDEFVYVLEGVAVLVTEDEEHRLSAGMCAGFPANGAAHHLVNRSMQRVVYLEIGDRSAGDAVAYPQDDLKAELDGEGKWVFSRKNGMPY